MIKWRNIFSRIFHMLTSNLFLALFSGFLVGSLFLIMIDVNPIEAYSLMLRQSLGKMSYIIQSINQATPIILTGLSVMFAFRAGIFNIGAEGQFIMGGIGTILAGYFLHLPWFLHIPISLMAGIMFGALWGGLAGWLKVQFGVHEVIATIMLNWIALYLNNFIIKTPWLHRSSSEASHKVLDSARIDLFYNWKISDEGRAVLKEHPFLQDLLRSDVHMGFLIALLAAWFVYFIMQKTTLGYRLRAVGYNPEAAEFAGIPVKRSLFTSMAIAGGLAGLGCAVRILGTSQEITVLGLMEGNGFDGIGVSLIGGATAFGTVLAGLLFGILKYGGRKLQILSVPSEIINIIIGSIIFFVAIPKFFNRRKSNPWVQKKSSELIEYLRKFTSSSKD